jgi:hypothetical protein
MAAYAFLALKYFQGESFWEIFTSVGVSPEQEKFTQTRLFRFCVIFIFIVGFLSLGMLIFFISLVKNFVNNPLVGFLLKNLRFCYVNLTLVVVVVVEYG